MLIEQDWKNTKEEAEKLIRQGELMIKINTEILKLAEQELSKGKKKGI